MSGTTTSGLPYPTPDDPVSRGADDIKDLAEAIDPRLAGAIASGSVPMPSTAGQQRTNVTVTLPTGFTATPAVTVTASSGAPELRQCSASAPSKTSFTAVYYNAGSTATGVSLMWVAVQPPATPAALEALSLDKVGDDTTDATVTCPNEACGNYGVAVPVSTTWTDEEGQTYPVTAFICGVCGTELTPEAA